MFISRALAQKLCLFSSANPACPQVIFAPSTVNFLESHVFIRMNILNFYYCLGFLEEWIP